MTSARPAKPLGATWWLWALLALNAAWCTDLFFLGGGFGTLAAPGALLTGLGRLTGLYGALGLVVQLVLIARIPWLERSLGMDRLTLWHRWSGFWVLWLLLAHVTFITLGYAGQDHSPVLGEIGTLLFDTQDVLKSAVAMVLLIVVAVTSARSARRKMRYESWHFAHLYAYLAVLLGFLHQVTVGRDFIGSPVGRVYWWGLYGTALAAVLAFRLILPVSRGLRHNLRVTSVVRESHDVVSIHVSGRQLDTLPARSGQFFLWRFLTKDQWWQAHPYSLSAMPDGRSLRITVKALGDGSAALHGIHPGTRVFAEGPYGAFTTRKRTKRGVLLIGGGVGVTPVRALLEELSAARDDVVVVYRVSDQRDAVLVDELRALARRNGARLHIVVGPSTATGRHGPIMGPAHLSAMVPRIRQRDVFLCGPPGMTAAVQRTLTQLGVPAGQCHTERFAFAA
ncbi:MAG: putative ferric reductase [Amycolatopsis sp.]|uniref:ferredoxin reductase family protein n=1 Tax=Amycolatopsis sp. TaxID=37632 RepID=UPI002612ED28|nr:ferredoxin reductase family protein [Amycolatopsis sp.]MCU1682681.1 putative ferric reductase [Amycolatopsis sp.]